MKIDASAFYPALEPYYNKGELPFIRVADVRESVINLENCLRIPESILPEFETLKLVKKGDVVLTKGGSVARAGLVQNIAAVTRDLIFINSSILSEEDYTFLSFYFQTEFCKRLMIRTSSLSVQPHLTITLIRELPLFIAEQVFKDKVALIVRESHAKLVECKALYAEAENLLLDELGLRDWSPSDDSISVKSLAESFADTGRLDAEYYQPKYDYALERLKNLTPKPLDIVPLVSLIKEITNGGTPLRHNLSEGDIPFLTAEHIFDFRINYASEKRITLEHHFIDMPRTRLKQNDIVIAIKGKVGNAAVVDNPPHEANINQDVGLFRLNTGINPYYIVGFLNSIIGKTFVEQISTGQINPFLGLGNLKRIKIPIFETELMNELGEHLKLKLNSAYKIAQQSKQLLEIAKRGVEIAIEDSEAAATAWIDKKLKAVE